MGKLSRFSIFLAALAMGTTFVGCDDDSGTSAKSEDPSSSSLDSSSSENEKSSLSDGSLKMGDSTDTYYKYDESQAKWLIANDDDVSLGLLGCTTNRTGEVGMGSDSAYYVCENNAWQLATGVDRNTNGFKCTSSEVGDTLSGVVDSTIKYYCTSNGWVSLLGGWSWDIPKEGRQNQNIEYGSMTDPRDGQTYKTVVIGEQTWMAENLNYSDSASTPSLKGKSWCYNDNEKYCAVAGLLYTWSAAIDSVALANDADNPQTCGKGETCTLPETVRGICPNGWHLPSDPEWSTLFNAVGGQENAGHFLKAASGWEYGSYGNDAYGFSAIPVGNRDSNGRFGDAGFDVHFWSSTTKEFDSIYMRLGIYDDAILGYIDRSEGYSVRCLKDSE